MKKLQYKSVASITCKWKKTEVFNNLHHEEQIRSLIKQTTFDWSMTHPPQEFHFGKVKDEKQNEQ